MSNKVERLKRKKKIKKKLRSAWYTSMKPLANFLTKCSDKRYAKLKEKCQSISDEELMAKFAKYIVKYLINSEYVKKEEFMVFNKGAYRYGFDDDFEERILYRLRNISSLCKDEVLKSWCYHNKKAKLYYKDEDEEMLTYERKLNKLLKQELDKLGVSAEYIDVRKTRIKKEDGYSFYGRWLDKIGYEKSLIIKVD